MSLIKLELNRPRNPVCPHVDRASKASPLLGRRGLWKDLAVLLFLFGPTEHPGRDRELKCPEDSQRLALASLLGT